MKFFLVFFLSFTLALNSFSQNQSKLDNYLDTAAVFKESGEYEKALAVLESFSREKKAVQYRGRLDFLSSRSEKALTTLNSLKDKSWIIFLYLGLIYEDLGKPDSALGSYSKSLKLKRNSIALFRSAKIYRSTGQNKKAADFFQKLIKFDPSVRLAYYYLGESFLKLEQYEKAYRFLSKAKEFYPDFKPAREGLSSARKELGEEFFAERNKKKEKERKRIEPPLYKPTKGLKLVRIGVARGLNGFSFSCGTPFIAEVKGKAFKGEANKLYKAVFKEGRVSISGYDDKVVYETLSVPFKLSSLNFKGKKGSFCVLDVIFDKGSFWHKKIDRAYRGDLEVIARNNKITLVNILSIEEYLYGVLPAEIPRLSAAQALKAQAVAARTFAFKNLGRHKAQGFDFCADVHCQAYRGILGEFFTTNNAVNGTKGLVITRKDKPVEVFYHSNCGGCLGSDTFGGSEDLICRADSENGDIPNSAYQEEQWFLEEQGGFYCRGSHANGRWQRVYDEEDFAIAFGYDLKDLKAVRAVEKGNCFRYKKINVVTSKGRKSLISGFKIRRYFDNLKSSAFKLEIKSSPENKPRMLLFWGAGFGHGVGLCQEGAMEMGKKNHSYQQILQHYYPNTELKKIH